MPHPVVVLGALLLCVWISFCQEDDNALNFGQDRYRWKTMSGKVTPPNFLPVQTPPVPIPQTPACPVMPIRIEQPVPYEVLNLTGAGLKQIGQAFVRSKNIREVYLDHNSITDIDPMAFDELPRLEVLSLIGNNISVARMLQFRAHPSLRTLIINNNMDTDGGNIINEILKPLPRLKQLFLRRDNITDLSIDLKAFAPRLELLDISGNRINSIHFLKNAPDTITELRLDENQIRSMEENIASNVKTLSVSGNRIEDLCGMASCSNSSFTLVGMTKLKKFNASRNSITSVAEDAFQDATGLVVLDLSNNKMVTLSSNVFNGLRVLRELRLNDNKLANVPYLCPLERLKYLNLGHNSIVEVTNNGLCNSPSLEELVLANNHIMDLHQESFLNLRMLRSLDVSNNAINELPIDLISKSRSLVNISLRNNRISTINELFTIRFDTAKELHLEDNPLPFINVACMSYLTIHLKSFTTMNYEETMYNDEDEDEAA